MDAPKTYKIVELNGISNLIGKCKNAHEIKYSKTVIAGVRLIRRITKIQMKHSEDQEAVLKAFDLAPKEKNGQMAYDWADRPEEEQEKIKAALKELSETEYSVDGMNVMDEEDFIVFTHGLESSAVAFLYDYLVKDAD